MMKSTTTTAHATPPMCSAMVLRSNCIVRPPGLPCALLERARFVLLREPEVDGDGHDHGDRHAVQKGGSVDPLLDRFDGRGVEKGDATEHLHVRDLALRADRALEDHDAL